MKTKLNKLENIQTSFAKELRNQVYTLKDKADKSNTFDMDNVNEIIKELGDMFEVLLQAKEVLSDYKVIDMHEEFELACLFMISTLKYGMKKGE